MATLAQSMGDSPPASWLREFLKQELAPFPGRSGLVARIVITSTLVMIAVMTFRIPYGALCATFTFSITRESEQATIKSSGILVIAFILAAADALVGGMLVLGNPTLHLVWVIGTLFMMFYWVSVLTNYGAAVAFGWALATVIPLFDNQVSAERKVEGVLWILGVLTLATLVTLLVELVLAKITSAVDLIRLLDDRLGSVQNLLSCYGEDCPVDPPTESNIRRLSMVGTSRLRAILQRTTCSAHYRETMGSVVALVGDLLDTAAALERVDFSADRNRIRVLAQDVGSIRSDLRSSSIPPLIEARNHTERSEAAPLLNKMESVVSIIAELLMSSRSLSAHDISLSGEDRASRIFVSDALVNPEHTKFALRGCLAAGLCYLTYHLIDWPTISTAVIACFFTALTTIGSSRQKQLLLVSGTIAGGLAGVLSQLFILPQADSIAGFTLPFMMVTAAAAWLVTSTPRLSNFGFQFAFAYNYLNLQDFTIQTSLTPARDRLAGMLLGVFMMWLVFDQLWGTPASVAMSKTFIATIRLLVDFEKEPVSQDAKTAIERNYFLRDTIVRNFDQVRALADVVLFEFGLSRQRELALRDKVRRWHPQLRALFALRVASWNYRALLPGFQLPEPVLLAMKEFDDELAIALAEMANRIEGTSTRSGNNLQDALEHLEQMIAISAPQESQGMFATQLHTARVRARRAAQLADSLLQDIRRS
jgi:multidrug resistance protein MdtO